MENSYFSFRLSSSLIKRLIFFFDLAREWSATLKNLNSDRSHCYVEYEENNSGKWVYVRAYCGDNEGGRKICMDLYTDLILAEKLVAVMVESVISEYNEYVKSNPDL